MKCTLREWQTRLKDFSELIVQASSMKKDDGWLPFPIGMSWQFVKVSAAGPAPLQLGAHEHLVLCCITESTDRARRPSGINRPSILQTLARNGLHNHKIPFQDYFFCLPSFKFVISPEGNGIDCHRHYEALLAGSIPIVERNPLTEEKYKGCPILWTTDYSEITSSYLESAYQRMLDVEYDFSCLLLSSYPPDIQTEIKASGNFWLQEIHETKCTWY